MDPLVDMLMKKYNIPAEQAAVLAKRVMNGSAPQAEGEPVSAPPPDDSRMRTRDAARMATDDKAKVAAEYAAIKTDPRNKGRFVPSFEEYVTRKQLLRDSRREVRPRALTNVAAPEGDEARFAEIWARKQKDEAELEAIQFRRDAQYRAEDRRRAPTAVDPAELARREFDSVKAFGKEQFISTLEDATTGWRTWR
jgi:hypothetical protein